MNHTTRAFPCSLIILTVLPLLWGCPSKGPVRPGVEPSTSVDPIFVEARNKVFLIGNDIAGPMGTAFLVTVQDKNYIITNFHVVGQIKDVTIETEDKVKYGGLQVLALDRRNDVAVLSAPSLPPDAKGFNVTHTFETSQKIFVIGFPNMRSKEEHLNFVTGVISDANYVAPPLMGTGQVKNIQITAPINAGNSGSPVLNERAEVVGVVSWRFGQQADIQGGNYAVPFQNATNLIMEIQSRTLPPPSLYPPGGACADDDECQWIYHCINGTCQTLADVGDACSVHDDCFLPYYCKGGVCTKIGALDDTCQDDSQCMPPNYCILGKCGPLRDKGEACAVDIDCVMPLYCIVGKCVASLSDAGGPCSQSIDCKSPLTCANGTCQQFQCTSDQQCYPLFCILGTCRELGKAGDSCGQDIDCKAGMKCLAGTCTAHAISQLGGPCQSDFDCQMPWYCLGGTCKDGAQIPKSTVKGSACTSDMQCQAPLYCILNKCQTLRCEGDPCKIDADCHLPFYCTSGVCTYKGPAPGGTCATDPDCQTPLYCILGQCQTIKCEGDPCGQTMDCHEPYLCKEGKCVMPPKTATVTGASSTTSKTGPPLKKQGESCKKDEECERPLVCSKGACTP
jgi:hypothetical protein